MAAHVIEAKTAYTFIIKHGQRVRVTDIDGQQAADFVCFSEHDYNERFSQAKTRVRNWTTQISSGDILVSNRDNVMFRIVEDTVGIHDIMLSECHSYVYEHIFKVGPRKGCYENLHEVLSPYGISIDDIPDPFDIFTDTEVTESGKLKINTAASKAGDFIELYAEMDCLVAVSACPDDVTDCNAGICTRIGIDILDTE